jgi:hypothetical protein
MAFASARADWSRSPILGILGAAAALIALVVVATLVFGDNRGKLAAHVPSNVEMFIEVPSIAAALESVVDMDIVDASKVDDKKLVDDLRRALQEAFGIDDKDAQHVVDNIESLAFAGREIGASNQAAAIISFSSGDGLEKLFNSPRFSRDGSVAGGERLSLKPVDVQQEWSWARRALSFASVRQGGDSVCMIWFADANILAMGQKDLVEDIGAVISDGKDSLANSEKYGQANFDSAASVIGFVDAKLLQTFDSKNEDKIVKGFFTNIAPLSGSVKTSSAGLLISMHGEMKGSLIGTDDIIAAPASLDLYDKLPAETVAYVAISTRQSDDGKALAKWIIDKVKAINQKDGDRFDKLLGEMKDDVGLGLDDYFDAVGDQMVFAFAAKEGLDIESADTSDYVDDIGYAFLAKVGVKEDADKLVAVLEKLSKRFVTLDFKVTNNHILIAGGGLASRFAKALESGESTLGDDAAHKAAMSVFSNRPRVLAWIDSGRAGKAALEWAEDKKDLRTDITSIEKETGVSVDALKLEGDKRITSAVALSLDGDGDTWRYSIESLNAPAFGMLSAAGYLMRFEPPVLPSGVMFVP